MLTQVAKTCITGPQLFPSASPARPASPSGHKKIQSHPKSDAEIRAAIKIQRWYRQKPKKIEPPPPPPAPTATWWQLNCCCCFYKDTIHEVEASKTWVDKDKKAKKQTLVKVAKEKDKLDAEKELDDSQRGLGTDEQKPKRKIIFEVESEVHLKRLMSMWRLTSKLIAMLSAEEKDEEASTSAEKSDINVTEVEEIDANKSQKKSSLTEDDNLSQKAVAGTSAENIAPVTEENKVQVPISSLDDEESSIGELKINS